MTPSIRNARLGSAHHVAPKRYAPALLEVPGSRKELSIPTKMTLKQADGCGRFARSGSHRELRRAHRSRRYKSVALNRMEHQSPIFAKDTRLNSRLATLFRLPMGRIRAHRAILFALLLFESRALAQNAPVSPDHPWHGVGEQRIDADAKNCCESRFSTDPAKSYSLAELIDLAETHNPETELAWERARAEAAALGVERRELFPILAAAALSQTSREETYLGTGYYRQTFQDFQGHWISTTRSLTLARELAESMPPKRTFWQPT